MIYTTGASPITLTDNTAVTILEAPTTTAADSFCLIAVGGPILFSVDGGTVWRYFLGGDPFRPQFSEKIPCHGPIKLVVKRATGNAGYTDVYAWTY